MMNREKTAATILLLGSLFYVALFSDETNEGDPWLVSDQHYHNEFRPVTVGANRLLDAIVANSSDSHYTTDTEAKPSVSLEPLVKAIMNNQRKARVFYNLFTKSARHIRPVTRIVNEQFALFDPLLHGTNVTVHSIGYPLPLADTLLGDYHVTRMHHTSGDETITLSSLWNHCKANPDDTVVYLHSKGSFHPSKMNDKFRNFLTHGALSSECADLPDTCNVCSSRVSPLPHIHPPGNMWSARCDYISKLIDPQAVKKGMLPKIMTVDNPGKGRGRFFAEHWVLSHPSAKPCDLYPDPKYLWGYTLLPPMGPIAKELRQAPRFTLDPYLALFQQRYRHRSDAKEDLVRIYLDDYKMLYNITQLDEGWWGWELYGRV